MDNFYSNQQNFDELLKIGIYCCAILRDNRGRTKGLKKNLKKLNKGEGCIFNNDTSNSNCLEMMGNELVILLTNINSKLTEKIIKIILLKI